MPDATKLGIYPRAWHYLRKKIASTRRQSISKGELRLWLYNALEQAVDECYNLPVITWIPPEDVKQETPQTPPV